MATELEIKLTISAASQSQALKWFFSRPEARAGDQMSLMNRYFDTPDADLNRAKAALRIRTAGNDCIQTLKTRGKFVGGAHSREEWEWPLAGPELDLSLLENTPIRENLDLGKLKTVFETNFQRQVIWLEDDHSVIEVAVDSGSIVTAEARRPLYEVEFELKQGDRSALHYWAAELAKSVPVFLNLVSKAEQGYHLAGIIRSAPGGIRGPVNVNEFLHTLSECWLWWQPFPREKVSLSDIERVARQAGQSQAWSEVERQLESGSLIQDVIENGQMGRFQLAIARAASG
jgi:inorganic triphosphatase YgiF